jgi:hypothetical protein
MATTPSTKSYAPAQIVQGPGNVWVIGNPPSDTAVRLTLASDGTPDSTAHAGSVHLGTIATAISTTVKPKMTQIQLDQYDAPFATYVDELAASIEAEMAQMESSLIQRALGVGVYGAGTGYEYVTFGGVLTVPKACLAVISPTRAAPKQYIVSLLYSAVSSGGFSVQLGKSKPAFYKAKFEGLSDTTRTAGKQIGVIYQTLADASGGTPTAMDNVVSQVYEGAGGFVAAGDGADGFGDPGDAGHGVDDTGRDDARGVHAPGDRERGDDVQRGAEDRDDQGRSVRRAGGRVGVGGVGEARSGADAGVDADAVEHAGSGDVHDVGRGVFADDVRRDDAAVADLRGGDRDEADGRDEGGVRLPVCRQYDGRDRADGEQQEAELLEGDVRRAAGSDQDARAADGRIPGNGVTVERIERVAMAVAADVNDELTIVMSAVHELVKATGVDDPRRPLVVEIQGAARRCAWKAQGLLGFVQRAKVEGAA